MFGTLGFMLLTVLLVFVSNTMYVAAAAAFGRMYYASVGFSGILFAYAVLETSMSTAPTRSLCGVAVPTRWYPWVLMVIIQVREMVQRRRSARARLTLRALRQVFIPGVSWLGHLTGALAGLLFASGALNWTFPSAASLHALEQRLVCQSLRDKPNFIRCPAQSPLTDEHRQAARCVPPSPRAHTAPGHCSSPAGCGRLQPLLLAHYCVHSHRCGTGAQTVCPHSNATRWLPLRGTGGDSTW